MTTIKNHNLRINSALNFVKNVNNNIAITNDIIIEEKFFIYLLQIDYI